MQQEVEHLRFANEGLEAHLAKLASAGDSGGGGGGGDVELELLRHELEDLRHDNAEMENGFHEAAAQVGSPALAFCLIHPFINAFHRRQPSGPFVCTAVASAT